MLESDRPKPHSHAERPQELPEKALKTLLTGNHGAVSPSLDFWRQDVTQAQASFTFVIFLPLVLKDWYYRHAPLHPSPIVENLSNKIKQCWGGDAVPLVDCSPIMHEDPGLDSQHYINCM